ncbi:MAG: hypothetical protein KBC69_04835 [Candidatus Magasanikbacteria bacterium]|nr:hypothetical protein [Candidatus Magasanikbacteria bacterium]
MKLKEFISALEKIVNKVDEPDTIEVRLADFAPVVSPVLKDNIVFVTDLNK